MRRVADIMEQRVYDIAAALVLEVGKNRMEALGEAQEAVDFFRCYADDFEKHNGYDLALPNDPLEGAVSRNRSVLRPYGVWAVISPFNFPLALAAGPTAAAMVTGNTVVLKCASDTPWSGRLLADCVRDAGIPAGVFNYVAGSGAAVGEALVRDSRTAGVTFTGSVAVGRAIMRELNSGPTPRPCIAEMGGKNPCIVTASADLDRAAGGIVRSAFGMGGQKCSALSRLYVHEAVADALLEKIEAQLDSGALGRGYYVEPVLAEAPTDHPLWKHEMFLPILMVQRFKDRDKAMQLANATEMGLTAGLYGNDDDVRWFQDSIEAGVTYANRPQGATTGAWPGYQAFGGWKASGSTGKAIGSYYYLPLYLREQSRTVVE
jgi:acyl-CoA reductase-like NAD-dependent aldehyde dehydrogenase